MAGGGRGRRPLQGGAEMSEVQGTRATPQCLKAIPPDSVVTGAMEKGAVGDGKKTPVLRP